MKRIDRVEWLADRATYFVRELVVRRGSGVSELGHLVITLEVLEQFECYVYADKWLITGRRQVKSAWKIYAGSHVNDGSNGVSSRTAVPLRGRRTNLPITGSSNA